MTKMKESGIDWIGQIPEEWEMNKFKYLFNTSKGLSITKDCLTEKGIPIINYGQIHSSLTKQVQSFDTRLPFINDSYLSNKNAQLNKGDFIFADTSEDLEGAGNFSTRLDSLGYFLAGYHTIIVRLKNNENHDFRYFMHLFDSIANRKQIQNKVSGVKVFSVTQGILNNIFVVIPPKTEQTKIADFLDKKTAQLDKVKALLEEQIQKLKDYRASLIYETVTKGLDKTVPMKDSGIDWIGQVPQGWGVIKFKYLGDVKQGLTYSPSDIVDKDEGILVLRSGNIQNGILDFNNNVYVKTKVAESILLRKNDILITARNGSPVLVGKNAIIDTDIKATFGAFMMVFRPNQSLFAKFAFYLMNVSFSFYRTFFTTSTVNQLTAAIFNGIEVPLPSIYEQKKITDFLDGKTVQIDKLIQIKNQQIENINKQRQTLIYDYVTGKRRV